MAVAFSTKATASQHNTVAVTSFTMTGIVISASVTDLVAQLAFGANVSSVSAHWDSTGTNQAMTQLVTKAATSNDSFVFLFGLHSPTADAGGTKTLSVSWTTASDYCADMSCYTGGGTFQNANSANGTGTGAALAVTSGANDVTVLVAASNSGAFTGGGTNVTVDFTDNTAVSGAGGHNAGATVTSNFTLSSATWCIAGIDITAAAAANPFVQTDLQPSRRVRAALLDTSFALNPNLFKNPIPIFNQFEPAKPFRLPLALPIPPDPLNINLFKNPYPFNQSDWSKPFRVPLALPQPAIGINPNIFTNPYPFNQYDWSKPIKVPQAPYSPPDPLNINLFKNPFPIFNLDTSRPSGVRGAPSPDIPYNQNLYIVTVVTAPFYAAEIFPVRRQVAAPLPDQPLNINLFTNPFPFNQTDWSKPFRTPQAPYSPTDPLNINLFTNPFPVLNLDTPRLSGVRGAPSPDIPYNQNLYTVTVVTAPFYAAEIFPARRLAAAPLPDQPLNINLFTNPYPIFNSDQSSSRPFPRVPPLDAAYNQNLYSVTIVTAPFYAAEIFPVRRPVSSPLSDPPLNINVFTNPFPIFNSDQSSSRSLPRILPIDPPYNQNIYSVTVTASLPFNQYDFTPSHFPAPRIVVDLPNLTILISVAPGAPPEVHNRPFFATVGQLMNIS